MVLENRVDRIIITPRRTHNRITATAAPPPPPPPSIQQCLPSTTLAIDNASCGLSWWFACAHRNVYMYALAYGLVGGGGNAPFIGGFHFASLFDAQGVRCAVLAAGFNIAGYFYRLLNVGPLSLEAFFYSAATFTVLLGIGISHVYPDTPHRRGDVTVLSLCPSSCNTAACMRAGVCGAGTVAEDRSAYAHGVITRAQGTG